MLSKLRVTTLAILVVVMLLSACQSGKVIGSDVTTEDGSYRAVSAAELQTMLENKDFFMVNVHTRWEGDIPQTTCSCLMTRLRIAWISSLEKKTPKSWCIA